MAAKPPLTLLIAAPRGFCAGVDRAIRIVELALERYGAPVYVRHEIVHNKFVVDSLKAKGAIFVPELDEVPDGVPVVFSAHGVPKAVPAKAEERGLEYLDATCPLVSKVHRQAERLVENGRHILFVGHAGHPRGTRHVRQVPEGAMTGRNGGPTPSGCNRHPDRRAFSPRRLVGRRHGATSPPARRFPQSRRRAANICYPRRTASGGQGERASVHFLLVIARPTARPRRLATSPSARHAARWSAAPPTSISPPCGRTHFWQHRRVLGAGGAGPRIVGPLADRFEAPEYPGRGSGARVFTLPPACWPPDRADAA